ncbi:MAG: hypothetical protein ACXW32_12275 [Limisphaerales bacterium]
MRAIGPTDINCEGFEHVTTRTQEDASFGGPSLGPVEFTAGTTPEHIKDKKTITPISSQPVVTMEFEWDFQRRPQG